MTGSHKGQYMQHFPCIWGYKYFGEAFWEKKKKKE